MAKKHRTGRQAEIETLSLALVQNGRAMEEGNKRKHWSSHDIKAIQPLTPTQDDMFHAWYNDKHICAHGSAGTGKTFLALYLAINEIIGKHQKKIIIVRSAVATRDVGFLPGTLEEKTALYELPYHDIMWELVGRASTYQDMKDAGLIEFMTTSFIRGLTWDNAIIIVDEGENMTLHEIDSIMTRVGENSRVMFTGDMKQTDLDGKKNGTSGMQDALKIFDRMKTFELLQFSKHDIVRSDFVKSWIIASEEAI
jgi:phosphate starvation-inducible protein PhoH